MSGSGKRRSRGMDFILGMIMGVLICLLISEVV